MLGDNYLIITQNSIFGVNPMSRFFDNNTVYRYSAFFDIFCSLSSGATPACAKNLFNCINPVKFLIKYCFFFINDTGLPNIIKFIKIWSRIAPKVVFRQKRVCFLLISRFGSNKSPKSGSSTLSFSLASHQSLHLLLYILLTLNFDHFLAHYC